MSFVNTHDGLWVPCGAKQRGAVQTTMQELAAKGLAAKVTFHFWIKMLAMCFKL